MTSGRGSKVTPFSMLMAAGPWAVAIVPVGLAAFSALGYGTALAIEAVFGIPREHAYDSTLGLMHLASIPITELFDRVTNGVVFYGLIKVTLAYLIVGLVASFGILALSRRMKVSPRRRRSWWARSRKRARVALAGRGVYRWFVPRKFYFLPLITVFAPGFAWLSMVVVLLGVSLMPVLAYGPAKGYYLKWVAGAQYCTPIETRTDLQRERAPGPHKVVPCLALWRSGELVAQGRHLASTSAHVLIFEPESGEIVREAIEGLTIRKAGLSLAMTKLCITASQERRPHQEGGGRYPQPPEQCRLSRTGYQVRSG